MPVQPTITDKERRKSKFNQNSKGTINTNFSKGLTVSEQPGKKARNMSEAQQNKNLSPAPGTSRKASTATDSINKAQTLTIVDESENAQQSSDAKPVSETPKKPSLFKSKMSGATAGATNEAGASAAEKPTLKSVAKRVNRQIKAMTMIKRWTEMTSHSQFANDNDHLQYMRNIAKHAAIDLPDPLIDNVREEVTIILQDTLKQYRMELGANHPLTQEMQTRIQNMKEHTATCATRDGRRDGNFFSVFNE
uniref:Uncharacterized LOC100185937 n=1 Tax=Ciona intestinalis TaxID=7719 RepID=F6RH56_CIOIN|nr:uncharacterized protein LOC100185937 [Ciona intestinalis]|eukprot:XP_002125429.1 uncharacterized protein LOC100185937 [Ciona intestinalis]